MANVDGKLNKEVANFVGFEDKKIADVDTIKKFVALDIQKTLRDNGKDEDDFVSLIDDYAVSFQTRDHSLFVASIQANKVDGTPELKLKRYKNAHYNSGLSQYEYQQ